MKEVETGADPAGVDLDALARRLGGNRGLIGDLIAIFLEEGPKNLEAIQTGIRRKDSEMIRLAGHMLKGSLSYFGTKQAIGLASQIEKLGRENEFEAVKPFAAELNRLIGVISIDLQQWSDEPIPDVRGVSP